MPILDIQNVNAPWAHLHVVAAMLQPAAPPDTHRKIVAGMRAAAALHWRRKDGAATERAKALLWDATAAEPFLLDRDAITAYAKQAHYNKGRLAGRILGMILAKTESRKGSLEWAYKEIHEQKSNQKGGSRLTLRDVWLEYGSVGHLWLAEAFQPLSDGLLQGDDLANFLGAAEAIRLAGEQHGSQTAAGRLLSAETTWRVAPALNLPVWNFSDGRVIPPKAV